MEVVKCYCLLFAGLYLMECFRYELLLLFISLSFLQKCIYIYFFAISFLDLDLRLQLFHLMYPCLLFLANPTNHKITSYYTT